MSCATRSGPISCISSWTRTRPTWRAGPTSPAPSASPPHSGGGGNFAHELGHNLGLLHDRYQVHRDEGRAGSHPAHGYVNRRPFTGSAPSSSRWRTLMAYDTQCGDAYISCSQLLRFSNPRQRYGGDPLGVPFAVGAAGGAGPADPAWGPLGETAAEAGAHRGAPVRPPRRGLIDSSTTPPPTVRTRAPVRPPRRGLIDPPALARAAGPADAAAVLDATGPAVALWRDRAARPNRPPTAAGALPDVTLALPGALAVDVSQAFVDPDGEPLTYGASSSAPERRGGGGGRRPGDADGRGRRRGDHPGDRGRPWRSERRAVVHGDGRRRAAGFIHRRPHPARA